MDPDPDLDPDHAIFVIDLQDANKNQLKKKIFCLLLFEGTFTLFFKDKKSKRSHKTVGIMLDDRRMIEGSGSGSRSIPLTKDQEHWIILYLEYQSVCPFIRIGSPSPLSPKRVCLPPLEPKGGQHLLAGEGAGGSRLGRLEKRPGTLSNTEKMYEFAYKTKTQIYLFDH
jgi:hypothetical protein